MMTTDSTLAQFQLNQLRASIDNMDAILVHTLAERFKATKEVGKLKASAPLPTKPASTRPSPRNSSLSSWRKLFATMSRSAATKLNFNSRDDTLQE